MAKSSTPETILEEAQRLVYGDREQSYGHPYVNMETFARLISAYLWGREAAAEEKDVDFELDGSDGAVIVALLKIARVSTGSRKRDTILDIAGYAAVLARVEGLDE